MVGGLEVGEETGIRDMSVGPFLSYGLEERRRIRRW